jgi:hypothetical protein
MNSKNYLKKHHKFNLLAIATGIFAFACVSANAADWTSIKKTTDHELWVDMDSYNESGGLPYITAKTVYKKPKMLAVKGIQLHYLEVHTKNQYDCKKLASKVLETRLYDAKNKLIDTKASVKAFEQIKSGSDDAIVASLTCQVYKMLGGF